MNSKSILITNIKCKGEIKMFLNEMIQNQLAEAEVEILIKYVEKNNNYNKLQAIDKNKECFCIQDFNKYDIAEGSVIIARISRDVTQKGTFYRLLSLRPCEEPINIFLPQSGINIDNYWNWLVQEASILRPSLRVIVSNCLAKYQSEFCRNFLNETAYNRLGGIVEATVNLIAMCKSFAALEAYRCVIDSDMLIASALIYYIDSTKLVDTYISRLESNLFCPNQISYHLVSETVSEIRNGDNEQAKLDLNDQDTCLLLHNISAKFNEYKACTIEAILLRQIDGMIKEMDSVCNQATGKSGLINLTESFTKKLYIP